jgi:uncharacterized protein YgbK (DUF1537 family)
MIGIVADDVTGAGDIGIMYAKAGYAAHVYSFAGEDAEYPRADEADVIVLDTHSRFDAPKEAYRKVQAATSWLRNRGCKRYIKKTCSVFRGNIGAECDAMLDALGETFAVVVLGFPKNGRTTVNGIHYVRGIKLEESEFRRDPVHPMTRSDLSGILRGQTGRPVAELHRDIVDRGPEEIRRAIAEKKAECAYLIVDVVDQRSLEAIAEAVEGEKVLCGSSALSEEIALRMRRSGVPCRAEPPAVPAGDGGGLLIVAGSLMPQTAAQVDTMRSAGAPVLELDTRKLLDPGLRVSVLGELADIIVRHNRAGRHVVVHSANHPGQVEETKRLGSEQGLSNTDVSRLVSDSLAEITAKVLEATGQSRAIIAGGDTSAAVCRRLGVQGMRIMGEIEPGLPSCLTFGEKPLLLALKSGSFGKPDFFPKAIDHLTNL